MAKDGRLCIYRDEFISDGFMAGTSEMTFARLNPIDGRWCVWLYTKHLQKTFGKLREALADINDEFVAWYRSRKG